MQGRREEIESALSRDGIPNLARRSCAYCHKRIEWCNNSNREVFCSCKINIYCSKGCVEMDQARPGYRHCARCEKIQALTADLRTRSQAFILSFDLLSLFDQPSYVGDLLRSGRTQYFVTKENLIKELILEGCQGNSAGELGNRNLDAYNFAIDHSLDLILLRAKEIPFILNIYLLTGRIEELYDLACLTTRKCLRKDLNDPVVGSIWRHELRHENVTRSYFKRKLWSKDSFYEDDNQLQMMAMCHVFLVKYLLYSSMDSLSLINGHFLNNRDCMKIIGEYVGVKKEWIHEKNWYRNQAFEVARLFHCEAQYFYPPCKTPLECFEDIQMSAKEHFPGGTSGVIDAAIEAGLKWIGSISCVEKQTQLMPTSRWTEVIQNYDADHSIVFTVHIQPLLPWVVKRINTLAGWNVVGMCADPSCCLTVFVTDAIKACRNRKSFFYDLFEFIDIGEHDDHEELVEFEPSQNGEFSRAVKMCLLTERKLAQCHFHKNKLSNKALAILDQLPGGRNAYIADPPPEDKEGSFHKFLECSVEVIDYLSVWPPDVTKVVDALFEGGLAINHNLGVLFGRSGYVSYQIMKLQQHREEIIGRHAISSFVARHRRWREGCTDNDKRKGLKIKYLNKIDRQQRFDDIRNQIPMGNYIQYLQPSLEQFTAKFGWKHLGISDNFLVECIAPENGGRSTSCSKRPRRELDRFLTVEEACRYYFDTSTIEEAIWDFVGVPRLVVLNGSITKMKKLGWKHCQDKANIGDRAVHLGQRVVHVYAGRCTIWKEQELQSESQSDLDMAEE